MNENQIDVYTIYHESNYLQIYVASSQIIRRHKRLLEFIHWTFCFTYPRTRGWAEWVAFYSDLVRSSCSHSARLRSFSNVSSHANLLEEVMLRAIVFIELLMLFSLCMCPNIYVHRKWVFRRASYNYSQSGTTRYRNRATSFVTTVISQYT